MRDETPGALYRPGLHVDAIMREYYKEQGTLRQREKAARADALRTPEPLVAKVKKPRLPAPDCPCGKPHFAKGLCRPHYFRQRYHQDHPDSPTVPTGWGISLVPPVRRFPTPPALPERNQDGGSQEDHEEPGVLHLPPLTEEQLGVGQIIGGVRGDHLQRILIMRSNC